MTSTEQVNILVSYTGGGYDGCLWEKNYFLFNANGEWHDVFSSGRNGLKTEERCLAALKSGRDEYDDELVIYDLTKHSEIHRFQNNEPVPYVIGITNKADTGEYGELATIWFKCHYCEKESTEGVAEDWHGCGGIAMTADKQVCRTCHESMTCSECGEFDSDAPKQNGLCDCHYKEALQKAILMLGQIDYIEFDSAQNRLYTIEPDSDDLLDQEENLFLIRLENGNNYLVPGDTEYCVIEDVFTVSGGRQMILSVEKDPIKKLIKEM
jgi:hypothetical protein